jgi:hypothetical protein
MLDKPDPHEILEVVTRMLREQLTPLLPPGAAFHARVAANAIDLVRRQIMTGEQLEAASLERLQTLLGDAHADAEHLERELCERIRDRRFTTATPGLVDHLMASTLAKMSVDQPNYASYRRELDQRAARAAGSADHPHNHKE